MITNLFVGHKNDVIFCAVFLRQSFLSQLVLGVDDKLDIPMSVCRFVGLSVCRFVGLSVCRFVGLSVGWEVFT